MTKLSSTQRTLQISKYYPPFKGGMEKIVYDLATGLAERNWKVQVLCANTKRQELCETGNIPVTRVASWGLFAATPIVPRMIIRLLELQRAHDVIHVHLPNPVANLALFLTRPKAKIVVHWHLDIIKQKKLLKLYAPLQNWLLNRADIIFATSPPYAESSTWLKPYLEKVRIALNCIRDPEADSSSSSRQEHALQIRTQYPGKKIVFALGRMTQYKGFDVLVKSAQHLGDDVVVLIGGTGELLEDHKKLAFELGLNEKVRFLGLVSDESLPGYYESADVFCLPSVSRNEAFGLVILEAMAFRKPVVATRIPGSGVSWVNRDGETGLNAAPGDPEDLARALKEILNDPERARLLGEGGRRRFEENFIIENMINAVIAAYEEICLPSRAIRS